MLPTDEELIIEVKSMAFAWDAKNSPNELEFFRLSNPIIPSLRISPRLLTLPIESIEWVSLRVTVTPFTEDEFVAEPNPVITVVPN
jgi:hypothetical protein